MTQTVSALSKSTLQMAGLDNRDIYFRKALSAMKKSKAGQWIARTEAVEEDAALDRRPGKASPRR
jgi:hypothetical protein